ncbi:OmpA family protein [Mongoliitalea daihaiensis]|uniref:OmpA family protein n=1 Tax=Mongoliitalea daihaiensis TaxID=2782006 RepID=UPI001F38BA8A|nr:OmpA family protein [Mongoliitalea daihaiensis]UJP64920.1 OmpA family protein [Mongoliitalea daihaiensis]
MQYFKKILLATCFMALSPLVWAQQKDFNWRLGASYGYSNYYGDLTPVRFQKIIDWDAIRHVLDYNPNTNLGASYQVMLERRVTNTIGFYMRYAFYDYSMNDRFTAKDGNLWMDAPNFDRGLNFRNQSRDYGIGFSFKTDNDRFLSSKSFIAPYLNLGVGLLDFKVFGDLRDNNGNFYDFSQANLIQNRQFETALHELEAEQGYEQRTFYTNLGLGVRFRLSSRIELFLQTDILRAFSNHLDDVAGKYRENFDNELQAQASNPTGIPVNLLTDYRGNRDNQVDWIINHGAGVRLNFGFNKKSFVAAQVIPLRGFTPLPNPKEEVESLTTERTLPSTDTYLPLNVYQEDKEAQIIRNSQVLLLDRQILTEQQKIRSMDSSQVATKYLLREFEEQNRQVRSRMLSNDLPIEEFDKESALRSQQLLRTLDSVQRDKNRSYFKIDSLIANKSKTQQESFTPRTGFLDVGNVVNTDSISPSASPLKDTNKGAIQKNEPLPERNNTTRDTPITQRQTQTSAEASERTTEFPKREATTTSEVERRSEGNDRNAALDNFYLSEIQRLRQENSTLRQQTSSPPPTRTAAQNQRIIVDDRGSARRNARAIQKEERRSERRGNRRSFLGGLFAGAAVSSAINSSEQEDKKNEPILEEVLVSTSDSASSTLIDLPQLEAVPARLAWTTNEIIPIDWTTIGAGIQQEKSAQEEVNEAEEIVVIPVEIPETIQLLPTKQLIFFDINQRVPTDEELKKLLPLAEFIQVNPAYYFRITGYADNTGSLAYNLRIAEDRMKAVGNALMEYYGVEESQIQYREGGKIIRGNTPRSEAQDRRVEVIIEKNNP